MEKDEIEISAWAFEKVWRTVRRACETISREWAFLAQGVEVPNPRKLEAALRKARGPVKRRGVE